MSVKSVFQVDASPLEPEPAPSDSGVPAQTHNGDEAGILKSAHKKVDYRLIAWYSFVYLIMRVHVSNTSNTAIINLEQGDGIKAQLGNLTSQQWAWVLSIFYYPYMLLEPVATLALKKFTPRVWMARIMVTWVCSTWWELSSYAENSLTDKSQNKRVLLACAKGQPPTTPGF